MREREGEREREKERERERERERVSSLLFQDYSIAGSLKTMACRDSFKPSTHKYQLHIRTTIHHLTSSMYCLPCKQYCYN